MFCVIQDIRAVIAPHPQLPSLPPVATMVAPPMTRARSDSKILMKPLPQVLEDETLPTSPINSSTGGRSFFRHNPFASPSENRFHRPSINSLRRVNTQQQARAPTRTQEYNHQQSPSISSIDSSDSSNSFSLSRSHSSSAGLGLDFSSSSRESLDFSDHSCLGSPESGGFSPVIPPAQTMESNKTDKWQQDPSIYIVNSNSFVWNNHLPPLPFFPMPAPFETIQANPNSLVTSNTNSLSRRHGRNRASSLHYPVLETILASPDLGEPEPSITLKVMTEKSNFLLKIPKSASFRNVKERIAGKCQKSDIILPKAFELALVTNLQGGTETATINRIFDTKTSVMSLHGNGEAVKVEDEQDWQLAVSLAKAKITIRII